MPFVTPADPAPGLVAPASWGDDVRNDLIYLANPPACRVTRSTAQAVVTATNTPVTFDTEQYDTASLHSTSVNTSRVTAPDTGIYWCAGGGDWAANATGTRKMFLIANASTVFAQSEVNNNGAGSLVSQNVAGPYKLNAGDYVELWVVQFSGGNLNFSGALFGAQWVGLG